MLNIEIIKFEAQDVITASTAECVCNPQLCTVGETTNGTPIVIHSNNCTAPEHDCGVTAKLPEC